MQLLARHGYPSSRHMRPSAPPLHQTGTRHWVSADRRRAHEPFTANLAPLGVLIDEPWARPTRDTPPASPSISALTTRAHRRSRQLAGLAGLYAEGDGLPIEVLPPPSPRKYWTRRGVKEWLVEQPGEPTPR